MKKKEKNVDELKEELFERYPSLGSCRDDFQKAFECLRASYMSGGKLLVAGNGGSAADSEHIVGELMKSFLFNRQINKDIETNLCDLFGEEGEKLAGKMEGALPALPLTSMPALTSAFANDVDAAVSFAQMLYGYANKGDVFLGISTSGNSKNIIYALMVAKAKGIPTIALAGGNGGKCRELADITICVPENETFKIQELHLPIYHALCSMLEAEFFEER
ncbi:MAG: SIS domain-containing protein [Oscillospiraceae bacterium]|nr:SIS domain-containing protein [Oscillospiraceae bacterium]